MRSRMLSMLGVFAAILSQSSSSAPVKGIPIPMHSWGGGGKYRKRNAKIKSSEKLKKVKSKRRLVKKSRSINAKYAKQSRFSK